MSINIEEAKTFCETIVDEITSIFVGNKLILKKMLAVGLANGHLLFEDYPGLGKTLLAKAFAKIIGCKFTRIQFTPDLLPADIIGTKVWRQRNSSFELMKGPIFTNILLADEINRTPPKTQAALLEAMEERHVTIEGETHFLTTPFIVLATQNPIEMEGTYPLPEAQMDRFLLRLSTGYAQTLDEETRILDRRIQWKKDDPTIDLNPLIHQDKFRSLQIIVENEIYVDRSILDYISQIVRRTREHPKVEVGSSPRGSLALFKASKAMALINGRDFVTPDDVKILVKDALAHRIILKMEHVMEGLREESIIEELVKIVPVPTDFRHR